MNLHAKGAPVIQLCRTLLIQSYSVFSRIPTQYILIQLCIKITLNTSELSDSDGGVTVFCNATLYNFTESIRRFKRICRFHFQNNRAKTIRAAGFSEKSKHIYHNKCCGIPPSCQPWNVTEYSEHRVDLRYYERRR